MTDVLDGPRPAWAGVSRRPSPARTATLLRSPLRQAGPRAVSCEPAALLGESRRWGRVPLATAVLHFLLAVAVVTTAVVRGADPALAAALLLVTGLQVSWARCSPGAPGLRAAAAAARRLVLATGALALGVHLLDQPERWVDDALAMGVAAAVVAAVAAALTARRSSPPRVVVVGDLAQVRGRIAQWLEAGNVDVAGALVLDSAPDAVATGLSDLGVPSVGSVADLLEYVEQQTVDLVVVTPGLAVGAAEVRRLSWALEGCGARLAVSNAVEQVAPHRVGIEVLAGSTLTVLRPPRADPVRTLVKSLLDRAGGALLAVVALPVVAVAAVAVRLDSRGPAFFTQTRIGRGGRPFTIYKLRTMRVDAERAKAALAGLDEGNGILFKIAEDPRVTPVGRLLRTTSIDELPQLLNVLKGDMSLVGPRPALPQEVARYTEEERRRLAVKPGITGPWQVSGRSLLNRHRSMELDSFYTDNWRPVDDGLILLRTVSAVLSRRGAC